MACATDGHALLPLMSMSMVFGSTPFGMEPQQRSGRCVSLYLLTTTLTRVSNGQLRVFFNTYLSFLNIKQSQYRYSTSQLMVYNNHFCVMQSLQMNSQCDVSGITLRPIAMNFTGHSVGRLPKSHWVFERGSARTRLPFNCWRIGLKSPRVHRARCCCCQSDTFS